MRKFALSVLLFSMFFVALLTTFFVMNSRYTPAPKFSNNVSFNEKVRFLGNINTTQADIITIGSSMALSNLSSQKITEQYPNKKYINISALGITLKEMYQIVREFVPHYKPEIVFMCGYPIDFREANQDLNTTSAISFLKSDKDLYFYLKHGDLSYYLKRTIFNIFKTTKMSEYDVLEYDMSGGIPLKVGGGESKMGRFSKSAFFKIDNSKYDYLDSICQFLSNENVMLKYIHSPVREGLMNDSLMGYLNKHSQRLELILKKYDFEYINTNEQLWNDSLFIDYIHLNEEGALYVTDFAIMGRDK